VVVGGLWARGRFHHNSRRKSAVLHRVRVAASSLGPTRSSRHCRHQHLCLAALNRASVLPRRSLRTILHSRGLNDCTRLFLQKFLILADRTHPQSPGHVPLRFRTTNRIRRSLQKSLASIRCLPVRSSWRPDCSACSSNLKAQNSARNFPLSELPGSIEAPADFRMALTTSIGPIQLWS